MASFSAMQRGILWAMTAFLGIVLTAALTWSASQLAGQRIGLAAAPLAVASNLAPTGTPVRHRTRPVKRAAVTRRPPSRTVSSPAAPTSSTPATPPPRSAPTYTYTVPAVRTTQSAPPPAPRTTATVNSSPTPVTTTQPPSSQGQRDDNGSGSGSGNHRDD